MLTQIHFDRLTSLPDDERTSLFALHNLPTPPLEDVSNSTLRTILSTKRIDHASLLRPILRSSRPTEIHILEVMVGKPIHRVTRITRHHQPQRLTRTRVIPEDHRVITGIVSNPKKQGSASYDRFALYKEGMTVSEARAAGVTTGDLKWDQEKGFITIA